MATEKAYIPTEISDQPITEGEATSRPITPTGKGVYTPETIPDQEIQKPVIARHVLSEILTTLGRRITGVLRFGRQGAIQIGDFEEGVSGRIRLDIDGFHAYNTSDKELVKVNIEGFHGQDESGNELVKVDSVGFHGYKSDGKEQIRISGTGIEGYGTEGNTFKFFNQQGGTQYGQQGYSLSQNGFYFASINGAGIYFFSAGNMVLSSANDKQIFLSASNQLTLHSSKNHVDIEASSDEGSGKVYLKGADTGSPYSSGVFLYDHDGGGYAEKTAILKTSQGFRALYCMESPEVWFMDFCPGIKKRRWPKFWEYDWVVSPDPLFLEVTERPYIVIPTLNKGTIQIWGRRKGQAKKRFEEKTKKEFEKNNEFWSTPQK